MNFDEQQEPVWQLLGKTRKAEVRPDFLQQVLAEIRRTPQDQPEPQSQTPPIAKVRHFPWPMFAGVGGLAAAAAVVWGLLTFFSPPATNQPEIVILPSDPAKMSAVDETMADDSLEQELVAVEGFSSLVSVDDPSKLNDAELLALLN